MEHSPSWQANKQSLRQRRDSPHFMEPKGSSPLQKKILKRTNKYTWIYECNFITQYHARGTLQGGEKKKTKTSIMLHNRTNEMHFLSFIFNNILYMFRIGKLFIIRRQCYMQRLVCIMHSYRLAAIIMKNELWWIAGLLETCRGYCQKWNSKIQSRLFYYIIYRDTRSI